MDAARKDYPRLDRERDCQRHVELLDRMCQAQRLRDPVPPSLASACQEFAARIA